MATFLAITVLACLPDAGEMSDLSRLDYYYAYSHVDSNHRTRATVLCESLLQQNPNDAGALWRRARLELAQGEGKTSRRDKLALFTTALDYAHRARRADPSSADAHYWYGVIVGRTAQVQGIVNFLTQIKEMKGAFEKAVAFDPHHAGALHGLGVWYAEASRFYTPWTANAIDYCLQALAADSNYSMTYVTLARLYSRQKNYPQARQVLRSCLALTNPAIPSDFYNYSKPEAEKHLVQIRNK